MPTHTQNKQYPRADLDNYYKAQLDLVNIIRLLVKKDTLNQEYSCQDGDLSLDSSPSQWSRFYKAFEKMSSLGLKLDLPKELDKEGQRMLASQLYKDYGRRDYYAKVISQRLKHVLKNEPSPLTLVELEERYQHYLYRKARHHQDLGLGPRFETWRYTDDCVTFYDSL